MVSAFNMADELKEVNLSSAIKVFVRENITPDIVSKLSLSEFETLGLTNRRLIMELRVKCSVFSSYIPQKVANSGGVAPKFHIPCEVLSNFLVEDFTIKVISRLIGVSERTIYRRMDEFGLCKLEFSDISGHVLDTKLSCLSLQFPLCGDRMLNEMLRNEGIFVQ